jgi:pyruvate/2-oxoglutarate dehydrogenase complex dihydrolipoamide acyltransferase (E2) component
MEPLSNQPVLVYLPKENNNDETARLLSWRVLAGTRVKAGQALAEFETSKTTFELYAPAEGIVQYRRREGEEVVVGGLVCMVSGDGLAVFPEEAAKEVIPKQASPPVLVSSPRPVVLASAPRSEETVPGGQRFSSLARALLNRHGLDPAQFAKRGLVRSCDVLASLAAQSAKSPMVNPLPKMENEAASVTLSASAPYRTEQISRSKRLEITLLRSGFQRTLPSAATLACPTLGLRSAAEQVGASLSAVLIYEVGRLLKKFPAFNAFFANDSHHFYEEVNIGFALDAGQGLKVPVVRHAEAKTLQELDRELRELMVQYLNDQLPVESLAGGTFTITDLAQEGTAFFSPLINQCQSAILGMGAELFAPGSDQGWFHLTLAFDHQLSNGREATRFLTELSRRLGAYEQAWSESFREEPYCRCCERTLSALTEIGAFLVEEVRPQATKGRICSLCLRGL